MSGAVRRDSYLGSWLGSGAATGDDEANEARFEEFAREQLLPFLRHEPHGPALLREHMVSLARRADEPGALARCVALVRSSRLALRPEDRLLRPTALLIDTALRCVYGSPRRDDEALELTMMMYKALPGRDDLGPEDLGPEDIGPVDLEPPETAPVPETALALETAPPFKGVAAAAAAEGEAPLPPPPGPEALEALLDELDELYAHLKSQHSLQEYGCLQPMGAYRQGEGGRGLSRERAQQLLRALARHTARRSPPATSAHWAQTRDDMVALRERACRELPPELPYIEWLQALLLTGQFRLANDYLRSYTEQLGLAAAEALVLDAAREYFNGASSTLDPALERMAECLRVLPQTTPAVEAEFRLLEGVKLLARYGCTPPPLQVRRLPDRLVLVLELIDGIARAEEEAAARAAAHAQAAAATAEAVRAAVGVSSSAAVAGRGDAVRMTSGSAVSATGWDGDDGWGDDWDEAASSTVARSE